MAFVVAIRILCDFGTIVMIIILLSLLLYQHKIQSLTKFAALNALGISENWTNCFKFNCILYKTLFG